MPGFAGRRPAPRRRGTRRRVTRARRDIARLVQERHERRVQREIVPAIVQIRGEHQRAALAGGAIDQRRLAGREPRQELAPGAGHARPVETLHEAERGRVRAETLEDRDAARRPAPASAPRASRRLPLRICSGRRRRGRRRPRRRRRPGPRQSTDRRHCARRRRAARGRGARVRASTAARRPHARPGARRSHDASCAPLTPRASIGSGRPRPLRARPARKTLRARDRPTAVTTRSDGTARVLEHDVPRVVRLQPVAVGDGDRRRRRARLGQRHVRRWFGPIAHRRRRRACPSSVSSTRASRARGPVFRIVAMTRSPAMHGGRSPPDSAAARRRPRPRSAPIRAPTRGRRRPSRSPADR